MNDAIAVLLLADSRREFGIQHPALESGWTALDTSLQALEPPDLLARSSC